MRDSLVNVNEKMGTLGRREDPRTNGTKSKNRLFTVSALSVQTLRFHLTDFFFVFKSKLASMLLIVQYIAIHTFSPFCNITE